MGTISDPGPARPRITLARTDPGGEPRVLLISPGLASMTPAEAEDLGEALLAAAAADGGGTRSSQVTEGAPVPAAVIRAGRD